MKNSTMVAWQRSAAHNSGVIPCSFSASLRIVIILITV
jgi:hypothetical protein